MQPGAEPIHFDIDIGWTRHEAAVNEPKHRGEVARPGNFDMGVDDEMT